MIKIVVIYIQLLWQMINLDHYYALLNRALAAMIADRPDAEIQGYLDNIVALATSDNDYRAILGQIAHPTPGMIPVNLIKGKSLPFFVRLFDEVRDKIQIDATPVKDLSRLPGPRRGVGTAPMLHFVPLPVHTQNQTVVSGNGLSYF